MCLISTYCSSDLIITPGCCCASIIVSQIPGSQSQQTPINIYIQATGSTSLLIYYLPSCDISTRPESNHNGLFGIGSTCIKCISIWNLHKIISPGEIYHCTTVYILCCTVMVYRSISS